jgi:hypothetical protein
VFHHLLLHCIFHALQINYTALDREVKEKSQFLEKTGILAPENSPAPFCYPQHVANEILSEYNRFN